MRPARIEFENVGCYYGKHALDLGPSVYAVLAGHKDNPERSNWLGKSTFLWLFAYALTGNHPERTDDDFISRGEARMSVTLTLDDGAVISRSKVRGKSTQVSFTPPAGCGVGVVTQAAAEAAVLLHIGLSERDFMATRFFEQKKLSRFVTSTSAGRTEIVESWIEEDLDPIRNMHAEAMSDMQALIKENSTKAESMETTRVRVAAMAALYGVEKVGELEVALRREVALKTELEASAKQGLTVANNANRAHAEQATARTLLQRQLADVTRLGTQAKEERDRLPDYADEDAPRAAWEEARAALATAEAKRATLAASARGEFDGACPVTRKPCPSGEWVRGCGVEPAEVRAATAEVKRLGEESRALEQRVGLVVQVVGKRARLEERLVELRESYAVIDARLDELPQATGATEAEAAVAQATSLYERAVRETAAVSLDLTTLLDLTANFEKLTQETEATRQTIALVGEAVQLLGRTGAQQRIAASALAEVEQRANAMLASSGIALTVAVRWQSETQGMAKHCTGCGTAFPTSAKVKECAVCGAARGPHLVNKLTVELSNKSGAAEDLAGFALGLAAAEWLCAKRASQWGAVFLDEPFGALDAYHKKALSVHIANLLRGTADAAFVVAHDRGILDALPSRVNIVAGEPRDIGIGVEQ